MRQENKVTTNSNPYLLVNFTEGKIKYLLKLVFTQNLANYLTIQAKQHIFLDINTEINW